MNGRPLRHGGDLLALARERGCAPEELLDFSASINPLGLADEVRQAIAASVDALVHYPEIDAGSLVDALAEHHDLPAAQLLAGSGSTEMIYLLPRALRPRRAVVVTPAFGEYARALELAGVPWVTAPLSPAAGFRFEPAAVLSACTPDTDMVFVANPGNPCAAGIPPAALLELAGKLATGTCLVVDEAFVDFCPEHSVLADIPRQPNLYVLRSLTKFYAIPGLRAGYLAGPREGIRCLAAARQPWSLSTPAIAAAKACLRATAYREQALRLLPQWRRQLADGLQQLGLEVFPACANYLLARLPATGPSAGLVTHLLRQQGILVRDCSDFAGLDERFLRMAVRGVPDNLRLLNALRGALQS